MIIWPEYLFIFQIPCEDRCERTWVLNTSVLKALIAGLQTNTSSQGMTEGFWKVRDWHPYLVN